MQKAALFTVTLALVASTGLAGRSLLAPAPAPSSCKTVAEVAQSAGLTTLLEAVKAAGLTSTFSDRNLFATVFAPTNQAFTDALTALNVTAAQVLASPDVLKPILLNHVLAYPLKAADLISKGVVNTEFNYAPINITTSGGSVYVATPVDQARVVTANVTACKSYVHVIDAVLIPEL